MRPASPKTHGVDGTTPAAGKTCVRLGISKPPQKQSQHRVDKTTRPCLNLELPDRLWQQENWDHPRQLTRVDSYVVTR